MIKQRFSRLLRASDGSALVEFAILAPAILSMMLGVFQIGIGMQNYNALRAVAADTARYSVVNYQTANKLSHTQLRNYARSIASAAPYGLLADRFDATVSQAATQRVAGATEMTITVTYDVPTVLSVIGIDDIPLSFSRPIFVVT